MRAAELALLMATGSKERVINVIDKGSMEAITNLLCKFVSFIVRETILILHIAQTDEYVVNLKIYLTDLVSILYIHSSNCFL